MVDLLIRGGTVVDGTGRDGQRADVAVTADVITAVGDLGAVSAHATIDAHGKVVSPGFIDIHSHSEWTIVANPGAGSSIHQGVTTEVLGNCGFSFAPTDDPAKVRPLVPPYLKDLVDVNWRSFGEYLRRIEGERPAINVAHMVGHHALRLTALGFEARSPSVREQGAMEAALARAFDEGAIGLSFGLEYSPGLHATTDEMVGLARVAAGRGRIVTIHMRNQEERYLEAIEEALEMPRQTGVSLQISHIPPHRGTPPDSWERALDLVNRAKAQGLSIGFDAHPYLWGGTLLAVVLPRWAQEGGVDAIQKRLADPGVRQEIKASSGAMLGSIGRGDEWDKFIVTYLKHSRHYVGKSVTEIAAEMGARDPHDAVLDLLAAEGEDLFGALWVTELIEPDVQKAILQHPDAIIMSDGMTLDVDGPLGQIGWHPRCFGWTARALGEHVRERGTLRLADAVHKMTQKPADKARLDRRGVVKTGNFADLVVFDPRTIHDNATYRLPSRYPTGIDYVIVNGQPVLSQGKASTDRRGRILGPNR